MEKFSQKALEYCLKLLSSRDYSHAGIREKLVNKGYSEMEANQIAGYLAQKHYIDEERMASNIIRKHTAENPASKALITAKMEEKGIDRAVFSGMTDKLNDSELALAAAELRKRQKPGDKKHFGDENYWYKYLGSKGFDYDIIDGIINKIKEETG